MHLPLINFVVAALLKVRAKDRSTAPKILSTKGGCFCNRGRTCPTWLEMCVALLSGEADPIDIENFTISPISFPEYCRMETFRETLLVEGANRVSFSYLSDTGNHVPNLDTWSGGL